MSLMDTLRRWLGGTSLDEVDRSIDRMRSEHHREINKMQPWERDRWFTERQRRAWGDDESQGAH